MKYLRKNKLLLLYSASVALLLISVILGLLLGAARLDLSSTVKALFGLERDSTAARIVWYLRIPRIAASLVCGAALAVSGAVIQAILANRLASPGIIGVNAGAGFAVTLCTSLGIIGGWRLSFFSFIGAFATVMLVSAIAKRYNAHSGTVILIGVALNSLLGALSDSLTVIDPDISAMTNDFRIGNFSSITYGKLIPAAITIIFGIIILTLLSTELEVITLGDERAHSLGLNVSLMRILFLLLAALLAGAAVSIAGLLSFVGLIVPNAVKRIYHLSAAHLITLCALFGAGFVTLCDTLSRVLFSPYEIPVGIIMAFIGAPFFIFILIKGKGGRSIA